MAARSRTGGTPADCGGRVPGGNVARGVVRLDADLAAGESARHPAEILREAHLFRSLASTVDWLVLLLRDRRVVLEDRAVPPQAFLAAREAPDELRVAAGFLQKAIFVFFDVLALPDVELLAGARGNVAGALLPAGAGHGDLDVGELHVGDVRELHVGDRALELVRSLAELVADGGVANDEGGTPGRDAGRDARRGLEVGDGGGDDRHGDLAGYGESHDERTCGARREECTITRQDSWFYHIANRRPISARRAARRVVQTRKIS
jgi:hypothetical protein